MKTEILLGRTEVIGTASRRREDRLDTPCRIHISRLLPKCTDDFIMMISISASRCLVSRLQYLPKHPQLYKTLVRDTYNDLSRLFS